MPGEYYQISVVVSDIDEENIFVTVGNPIGDNKLYIQDTPPADPPSVYMWVELLPDNKLTMWIEDGL